MPRRFAVPAIALVIAFLGGVHPAFAADDRAEFFAEQLKRSPVFVSDSVTRRFGDAEREALLRDVKAMPFPTFVVVAPSLSEDVSLTGADRLALLRDSLGEDGMYIISDDRGTDLNVAAYGVQLKLRAPDVGMSTYYDFDRDEPGLDKLQYALALARGEPRMPRSERAFIPQDEGGPVPTPYREYGEREESSVLLPALGAFLFGGALSATGLERRRRRRLTRGRRHAGSVPAKDIRQRATNARERLVRDLARRKAPNERALDLEVAAAMALERNGKPIDDLGALVLAERGREALSGSERDRCFFDPRHAGRATPTRWQNDKAMIEVPACKRCAQAIAAGEVPDSLFDRDRPYWQRDTVWARTGMGALRKDMRRALAEDRK